MQHSIAKLARHFARGTMTPREVIHDALGRIDRLDGELEAWQVVYADEAREAGAASSALLATGHRSGPFQGIPFALKDIVDLEGRITTAGSAALLDRTPSTTAVIARRLLAAGGILIGKTKTVELALGGWGTNQHLGMPRNPWDRAEVRAPGGSSSGSAVAVASGMVPCAIGTDTGGSVRLPAAFCGLVGLKTTEGLLPTDGIVPLSHTLDTPGPIARTVEDATLMFDVLTGRHPAQIDDDWRRGEGLYRDPPDNLRGMRLGTLADHERALLSTNMIERYDAALDQLDDLGADIQQLPTPMSFEEMKELTFVIVTAEAWHHHGHLFADPEAPLDEHVRARALAGREITAARYIGALRDRRRHRAELLVTMAGFDAMVTPTTPDTAPTVDEIDESSTPALFTRAANLLAQSALSVPVGLTADGLPAAIQFVGRGFDEASLLRLGAAYERARGPMPLPPIH